MLFPAISSRVQPSTALQPADHPLPAFSEEETTVFMMLEPSSEVEPIPTPQLDAKKRLNEALAERETTQVGKPYLSADMFLSEQVGNPKKTKEDYEELGLGMSLINGVFVTSLSYLGSKMLQSLSNQHKSQALSKEAYSHTAMAPLAQASEKNMLLGKISTASSEKNVSAGAKALLTHIQAQTDASVADLHQALGAFKHLQAREALESSSAVLKWSPLALGLSYVVGRLYGTYLNSSEVEKRQVETNQRNRAILNQAGRDLTLRQARENFPEYFSPLNKPSAN